MEQLVREKMPTQKVDNIVSCGMRDVVPSRYGVLSRVGALSLQVKKVITRIRTLYE